MALLTIILALVQSRGDMLDVLGVFWALLDGEEGQLSNSTLRSDLRVSVRRITRRRGGWYHLLSFPLLRVSTGELSHCYLLLRDERGGVESLMSAMNTEGFIR
jgi:hypothetical protein